MRAFLAGRARSAGWSTRGQLICAGWVPHDRVFVGAGGWSRVERRPGGLLIGSSPVALALPSALTTPVGIVVVSSTARLQHRPASSRATATAVTVERLPRSSSRCQRWCRRVAGVSAVPDHRGVGLLAAQQLAAGPKRPAVMPGRFHQQPPGVRVAGLRDPALAAALAGRVLARHQPQVGTDGGTEKRVQSPISTANATPVRVPTPRRQQSRATTSAPRAARAPARAIA